MQIEDMDFKGKWTTRCGLIAIVDHKIENVGWGGILEIPPHYEVLALWDLNGKSKDNKYDLMERRLEGEGL